MPILKIPLKKKREQLQIKTEKKNIPKKNNERNACKRAQKLHKTTQKKKIPKFTLMFLPNK